MGDIYIYIYTLNNSIEREEQWGIYVLNNSIERADRVKLTINSFCYNFSY